MISRSSGRVPVYVNQRGRPGDSAGTRTKRPTRELTPLRGRKPDSPQHPNFCRLRDDQKVKDVRREDPKARRTSPLVSVACGAPPLHVPPFVQPFVLPLISSS